MVEWEFHGKQFVNCNCAYGCPCQFNARPTYGDCRAVIFFHIDTGHFGATRLDGLNAAFAAAWPGAIHEGHGRMQPIIDQRADDAQRQAVHAIMTGKAQRAGIVLPDGFEFGRNEVGRGWSNATGALAIDLADSYAHWCELHFNRHGRIH